jgi:uncharacterized membrane protein YdjX (TVP38/TMEM64 family)
MARSGQPVAVHDRAQVFLGFGIVLFPVLLLIMACAAVFGQLSGSSIVTAGLLASAALNYAMGWLGLAGATEQAGPAL